MTETLLELQAVEVSYGQARALNGVNLTVPEGRIVSLLGGNASGKSTTMKTILGLVRPDAGRVLLDGKDITTWPTSRRVSLDYDFGEPAAEIFAFVGNAQGDLECCIGVDLGDGRVFVEQLCRRPSVHRFAYGQT